VAIGTAQITAAASGVTSAPGAVTVYRHYEHRSGAIACVHGGETNTLQFSATATGSGVTLPGTSSRGPAARRM